MADPKSKNKSNASPNRKYEAEFSLAAGLRLAPASSSRQPVEGEFPQDDTANDPESRQRMVGKLIDFFKKY